MTVVVDAGHSSSLGRRRGSSRSQSICLALAARVALADAVHPPQVAASLAGGRSRVIIARHVHGLAQYTWSDAVNPTASVPRSPIAILSRRRAPSDGMLSQLRLRAWSPVSSIDRRARGPRSRSQRGIVEHLPRPEATAVWSNGRCAIQPWVLLPAAAATSSPRSSGGARQADT